MTIPRDIIESLEQKWNQLTIANDFVFCKAMLDPDLCRDVLEAILDEPVERIEYIHRQEVLDASPDQKSVRLDVYVRDQAGVAYNVEMQAVNTGELPKRARYYQSLMTLDQISRGERYSRLKDSVVIFICNFDPFDSSRRVYSFRNRCDDEPSLALGDGTRTVFLSAATSNAGPAKPVDELLDYVASGKVTGELSRRLESSVAKVLDNQKWRLEYMLLEVRDQLNYDKGMEMGLREGRETGLREGRELGMTEGEQRMAALVGMLVSQGRTDDLTRMATDASYREKLLEELGE